MPKLTYYGHASFLLEHQGVRFFFDPAWSILSDTSKLNTEDLKIDYLCLTHAHADHIADVEPLMAMNPDAVLISNFEICSYYESKYGYKTISLNHGGGADLSKGRIQYVTAIHSSVFPDGSNGGNPGGFVLKFEDYSIYISGDTALTQDMKLIPMLYGPINSAIICLGDVFTMDYKAASVAANFVGTNQIIGCHFDTFPPLRIDHAAAKAHFQMNNQSLYLLDLGEQIELK